MTEQELIRIKAGFEECNRRMQEYSEGLKRVSGTCGTLVEQVQRLKDAVALALATANDANKPPVTIKELMIGDRVRADKGRVGTIVSIAESFVVTIDETQIKEIISADKLKRIK